MDYCRRQQSSESARTRGRPSVAGVRGEVRRGGRLGRRPRTAAVRPTWRPAFHCRRHASATAPSRKTTTRAIAHMARKACGLPDCTISTASRNVRCAVSSAVDAGSSRFLQRMTIARGFPPVHRRCTRMALEPNSKRSRSPGPPPRNGEGNHGAPLLCRRPRGSRGRKTTSTRRQKRQACVRRRMAKAIAPSTTAARGILTSTASRPRSCAPSAAVNATAALSTPSPPPSSIATARGMPRVTSPTSGGRLRVAPITKPRAYGPIYCRH